MNKKLFIFATITALAPLFVGAANITDADSLFTQLGSWLGTIGQLIIAATVVAFFWGLFMFVFGGEDKKDDGKSMMTWGILALFIMVSFWGIIGFLQKTTNTEGSGAGDINIQNLVPEVNN